MRRSRTTSGFVTHPEPVAVSQYVGVLAAGNVELEVGVDRRVAEHHEASPGRDALGATPIEHKEVTLGK